MARRKLRESSSNGQSFVELAIVLPLLLFMLIGFVEVGALVYSYLTILDAAREAARFAANQDPERLQMAGVGGHCADNRVHFYEDTACVVIDSQFNPDITLNPSTDDVTISAFWIENNNFNPGGADGDIRWPEPPDDGVWSKYSDNWMEACDGSIISATPWFTNADMDNRLAEVVAGGTPPPDNKGMVLVEVYYCHGQLLGLPVIGDLIPDPIRLHAYAFMPAPAAQP